MLLTILTNQKLRESNSTLFIILWTFFFLYNLIVERERIWIINVFVQNRKKMLIELKALSYNFIVEVTNSCFFLMCILSTYGKYKIYKILHLLIFFEIPSLLNKNPYYHIQYGIRSSLFGNLSICLFHDSSFISCI